MEEGTPIGEIEVDLFVPADAGDANNPAGFTSLPAGDLALLRAKPIRLQLASGVLDIALPDPVGFIAMKLVAKQRLRPTETKDCFDIYAYVSMKGAETVRAALAADAQAGPRLSSELRQLYGDLDSPGVRDVLAYAATLGNEERALLARAVVDLFHLVMQ